MKRNLRPLLTIALLIVNSVALDALAQSVNCKGHGKESSRASAPVKVSLPLKDGSVRFAIIGDTGTGSDKQYQVANVMLGARETFPFEFVLMMGDNLYGGEVPKDFQKKFENVYRALLDKQVKFYATLGNHDEPAQRFYEYFNRKGRSITSSQRET